MRTVLAFLAALLPWGAGFAQAAPMSAYLGAYRPVIVFAPEASWPAYVQQMSLLRAQSGGLRERNMVVIGVASRAVSAMGGRSPQAKAEALRSVYAVSPTEFQVVLVGKDGGVKFRSGAVTSPAALFALVDGMPMRQDEMRR